MHHSHSKFCGSQQRASEEQHLIRFPFCSQQQQQGQQEFQQHQQYQLHLRQSHMGLPTPMFTAIPGFCFCRNDPFQFPGVASPPHIDPHADDRYYIPAYYPGQAVHYEKPSKPPPIALPEYALLDGILKGYYPWGPNTPPPKRKLKNRKEITITGVGDTEEPLSPTLFAAVTATERPRPTKPFDVLKVPAPLLSPDNLSQEEINSLLLLPENNPFLLFQCMLDSQVSPALVAHYVLLVSHFLGGRCETLLLEQAQALFDFISDEAHASSSSTALSALPYSHNMAPYVNPPFSNQKFACSSPQLQFQGMPPTSPTVISEIPMGRPQPNFKEWPPLSPPNRPRCSNHNKKKFHNEYYDGGWPQYPMRSDQVMQRDPYYDPNGEFDPKRLHHYNKFHMGFKHKIGNLKEIGNREDPMCLKDCTSRIGSQDEQQDPERYPTRLSDLRPAYRR
eukprot:Platyproteum_vivax@DN7298_c0_g1_i3.p1